ncbi:BldC family transcriptional regulator [Nonomuraea bangladeshensis]|uniref:BldC family transcriptional regulator n=1 Tax=Nonomuraea bangladeshensis TaxID=404385 RepID=UPI003C2D72ED
MPDNTVQAAQEDRLMTRGEVAQMVGVDTKTVTRWAQAGKLRAHRTGGGHRRYRESDVRALMRGDGS